ncbi:MAG: oxygenase MpaB family protein [Rhodococcus sp. (in: high G+C Gram-positive bacteria)]
MTTVLPQPNRGRTGWVDVIDRLDPVLDAATIVKISAGCEFPWDYQRSLEFALFRTYCVPTISNLLRRTGEFEKRPQKRYDDTALLMGELVEHGYDSERGRASLRAVNRMHARYDIDNDDMIYVLSTFAFDPIEWIDRYGWRRLHPHERTANVEFYRQVGTRMGIRDVPASDSEFHSFKLRYERARFTYSDDNRVIGEYTRDLLASWYPRPVRPVVRGVVYALIDDDMTRAFGFPAAVRGLLPTVDCALRARSRALRVFPKRTASKSTEDPRNRTYPGYPVGYHPSDLGV